MTQHEFAARLQGLDVVIVCGSGGVGKTSIAASLAFAEAQRGRRVCVLTIDPARRLADAMGIDELDDTERPVTIPRGLDSGNGGSLHALMLDPKQTFDRMVSEMASSDEERDRVLDNQIYHQISRSALGVQEYMALERLYELDRTDRYDLIVVDTPPAAHARDLLDSPHRILSFLEGRSLRWFLKPGARAGRLGLRVVGGSGGPVVRVLERVTGAQMLRDATEFFESMEGMYDGIAERVRVAERIFANPSTGFVIVTSPERESVEQAVDFWQLLEERRYSFLGTIVNRIEPAVGDAARIDELTTLPNVDASFAARLAAAHTDHAALANRDQGRLAELAAATGKALTIAVPRQAVLPGDLTGLDILARAMLTES